MRGPDASDLAPIVRDRDRARKLSDHLFESTRPSIGCVADAPMPDRGDLGNRGSRRPTGRDGGRFTPPPRKGPAPGQPPRRGGGLNLRRVGGDDYELIHPKCVEELWPDYEEGLELLKAGEPEDARDALRYALQGCGDNIWVHVALGRIALEQGNDPTLARGHFGYGYELARKAIPEGFRGRLPRQRPANRPLFDAIDGLVACHEALKQPAEAAELRAISARWSPV